ncbi:MAG: DUF1838 family protein [Actinomycetota bacterium]
MTDLRTPEGGLAGLLKARASLDGRDTVTWFNGTTWGWVPGEQQRPVFAFEGYNVARAVPAEDGFDLLTREAVFYLDLATRAPLDRWSNPYTGSDVEVVHIWNDPVNQRLRPGGPRGPFRLPVTDCGDEIVMTLDVYLTHPSPLPPSEFPQHSGADLYQAAELFQFFCRRADVADDAVADAPSRVSWTRIGPWLPWMEMADRPGMLVYHGQGAKLPGGYAELPEWIRARVDAQAPQFATAPREFTEPNETSWTYFRKHLQARGANR